MCLSALRQGAWLVHAPWDGLVLARSLGGERDPSTPEPPVEPPVHVHELNARFFG
jgi:hypothetical protein